MVSSVLSGLVCVVCVILLPAVWADYCDSYWDTDGDYHESQQCVPQYCCGNCNRKYCCLEIQNRLTQAKQDRCPGRSSKHKTINLPMLLGSIFGSIFPIILCVALIVCCVAPCCLLYKKCRKGRNRRHQNVRNTAVVYNLPQQPLSPSGYQPPHPGYQPVPDQPGYGGLPIPTAPPPSYLEATDPAYSPVAYTLGQPTYPLTFPGQPYTPPPHPDHLEQPPYNPSYGLNPYP